MHNALNNNALKMPALRNTAYSITQNKLSASVLTIPLQKFGFGPWPDINKIKYMCKLSFPNCEETKIVYP